MKPITESLKSIVKRGKKSRARCIWGGRRYSTEKPNNTEDFQTHCSSSSFSSCRTAPTSCRHTCDFTRRRGRGGIFSFKSAGASSWRWRRRRGRGVRWVDGGGPLPPAHINHAKFCQTAEKMSACWRSFGTWTFQEVPVKAGLCWAVRPAKVSLLAPGGGAWLHGPPLGSWLVVRGCFFFSRYFLLLCVSNIACRNLQGFVDTSRLTRRTRSTV